ncbi:hypothetical protein NZK32_15750 [Cyanobium sp. FGCU-52]|nr:hypothetical protein [Cyanobium sp. FGCU52]
MAVHTRSTHELPDQRWMGTVELAWRVHRIPSALPGWLVPPHRNLSMRFRFCALAVGLAGLMAAPAALACSRVLWVGGPDQVFVGRTQDWTEKANTAFRVYPRGIARTGAVTVNPLQWTSKYGSLVLSA